MMARAFHAASVLLLFAIAVTGCSPDATPVVDESASSPPGGVDREAELEALWEVMMAPYPGEIRPEVDLIRYVDQSEMPQVQAACLNEAGYVATVSPDGGVAVAGVPESQMRTYRVASYVCMAQFPLDPKYTAPLTESQVGELYQYNVEVLIPCLEQEGFSVSEIPSLTKFSETFGSDPWFPYEAAFASAEFSEDDWYRVNARCPQWPDDLWG